MEDKIQRLVNAANSTNAVAKEIGEKQLRELGLDNNGNPLKSAPTKEAKPKAERKKREPKAKVVSTNEKRESPDKDKDYKTYCDELISKADERKAKAKAAAEKRANEPKKTDATKNKEAIEKAATRVEKNVEKRVKKGDVSVAEIDKIIAEYETALTKLRALREKATSKMRKGGGVDAEEVEHILMRAQGVKEHHCGCNDKKMAFGGKFSEMSYGEKYLNEHKYASELWDNLSSKDRAELLESKNVGMNPIHTKKYKDKPYNNLPSLYVNEVKKELLADQMAKGGKLVRRNDRDYPTGSAWTVEHNKRNKGEKWEQYADGGGVGKGYKVFNYTDNIFASDKTFSNKTKANEFIKEFRQRYERQGYYRDNRMRKVDIKDIDLLAIPADFNPYEKMATGGGVDFKKNWEVVYITLQGKMGKKTITLGRMSDKEDVKQALRRMDLNIREVTSIKEVK